jgi:hypothetical protein
VTGFHILAQVTQHVKLTHVRATVDVPVVARCPEGLCLARDTLATYVHSYAAAAGAKDSQVTDHHDAYVVEECISRSLPTGVQLHDQYWQTDSLTDPDSTSTKLSKWNLLA